MALAGLLAAVPARAQLGSVRPAERLVSGQRANAFVEWGGAVPLDGVALDLPAGWALVEAQAVRAGSHAVVPLRVAVADAQAGRFRALAAAPLRGAHLLILGVTVGRPTGFAEATLTPLRRGPDGRPAPLVAWQTAWGTSVGEATERGRGRALGRQGDAPPLILDRRALPSLNADDAFTVEAWLRTTRLSEVVLSTWDGREGQTYPLEWVVDARGRLVVYRGEPGRHLGMRTAAPVADGRWHHVAVTHDAARGWARLYLDGRGTDSLRIQPSGLSNNVLPLALGGRRAQDRDARTGRPFTGLLDEVRFWDRARSPGEIRFTMRRPLTERLPGLVRLGFDSSVPGALLAEAAGRVYAPSDLSFSFPVEALAAQANGGAVRLTWETKDRENERFAVERSTDGRTFRPVGEVRREERVAEAADGTLRYSFTDAPPAAPVLHYRVRQRFSSGEPDRLSAALKLGLGADGAPTAAILGNSPNPFVTSTAIQFEVREAGPARLSVWDVSGARVAVLVDGEVAAGRHEVRFDATELPSGVYFVQLQTPDARLTHKLTLAR